MRILFVSSEVYPYSKTGGLADVAGALPEALARAGHEVLVVTPWYRELRAGAPLWIGDVAVPFDGGECAVGVGTLERNGVRLAFVGHEDYRRETLYGYPDDVYRFCRFARAVPEVAARVGFVPQVVHVHDWHAAYIPLLLGLGVQLPEGFAGLPTVLTVHNAQYQGVSGVVETLRWLRLPATLGSSALSHRGQANALAAGCSFADRVTTVSPSYARELPTPEYGYGLEGNFAAADSKLIGILNGIETAVWDPAADPHLPAPYGVEDTSGKRASKLELCRRSGVDPQRPLLGVVSRLAEQKGIDLLLRAAPALLEQGWSLFVLGSGEEHLEADLRGLSAAHPCLAASLEYDEALAHLVYAGSDALAIPSRFEPCGLSQMIAMRYGTLPIARATGGLRDTIVHAQSGFLFSELQPAALVRAAGEALSLYGSLGWAAMMRTAMRSDFSWTQSALRYGELYDELGRADERTDR